jgi:CHAT domain-containing protein
LSQNTPRKLALLVGINKYQNGIPLLGVTTMKKYPHPVDWAAFTLIGEAESLHIQ